VFRFITVLTIFLAGSVATFGMDCCVPKEIETFTNTEQRDIPSSTDSYMGELGETMTSMDNCSSCPIGLCAYQMCCDSAFANSIAGYGLVSVERVATDQSPRVLKTIPETPLYSKDLTSGFETSASSSPLIRGEVRSRLQVRLL